MMKENESLPQPWNKESEAGIRRLIEDRDRARELAAKKTAEAEDNLVRAVLAERENAKLRAGVPAPLTEEQLMDFSLDLGEQECYQLGYNKATELARISALSVWKPMDEAPKDGTKFVAWHVIWKCPVTIHYNPGEAMDPTCPWLTGTIDQIWPTEAFTHWQPLPPPPKTTP